MERSVNVMEITMQRFMTLRHLRPVRIVVNLTQENRMRYQWFHWVRGFTSDIFLERQPICQ